MFNLANYLRHDAIENFFSNENSRPRPRIFSITMTTKQEAEDLMHEMLPWRNGCCGNMARYLPKRESICVSMMMKLIR